MNGVWRYAAVALAAGVGAPLWPLTAALSSATHFRRAWPPRWSPPSLVPFSLSSRRFVPGSGLACRFSRPRPAWLLLFEHFNASAACTAEYDGRLVIIGREYAPDVEVYVRRQSRSLRLGPLVRRWGRTGARSGRRISIRSCRCWVSWAGLARSRFFAAVRRALISSRPSGLPAGPAKDRRGRPRAPAERARLRRLHQLSAPGTRQDAGSRDAGIARRPWLAGGDRFP